jgi:hypothetical protein
VVEIVLQTTGIDLQNGGGIPELEKFQEYFNEYRIVVYGGLNCEDIIYDARVDSERRLNLLYDYVTIFYHVITSLKGAMAKNTYARGVVKAARSERRTGVSMRVAIACPYRHVPSQALGSHAASVTRLWKSDVL